MKYTSQDQMLLVELHERVMQLNCKLSENILPAHSYHYKNFTSVSAGREREAMPCQSH